ncbi:MAG TPA: bifunctional diguanylate cyclase/phosphodiesterase [Acidimicrobiales bacterium]|jgi:diguanylate cyclase (GGDEF)-like protein|nr:bifunctional diguanylate cyclase/phosphodiesterase [Acidimicrobiales bacterium]
MRDDPRAARDVALAVIAVIVVTMGALSTHAVDHALSLAPFGFRNLNGIIPLLLAVPVATTVFSFRRYRDASQARRELARISMLDSLTGLPNRRSLPTWYQRGVARAAEDASHMAVLFVDLDHFKAVNDTHGHDIGDQLLAEVALRLKSAVRPSDRVVRYGGDEFVILGNDVVVAQAATRLAERVIAALEEPFDLGDQRITISASVGIAVVDAHSGSMDSVLGAADSAMYEAKSRGTGNFVVVDAAHEHQPSRRARQDKELREALDDGQFILHYQPVVAVSDARMVGAEALIRWNHPERGLVFPGEFIQDLEDSGLIVPVGQWVLQEACRQAREWQDAFPDTTFRVKLNVSASQLARPDFGDIVVAALRETGVRPERVCFEITESALMHDVAGAWATLRQAKDRGITLALDDFGTGYSSLNHLRRFNLDYLKIDKSFVDGLGRTQEDTAIIEHVIGLAHALGLAVVAEGIEQEHQYTALRLLGCDYAQGFFFSRGQPAEVITRLLRIAASSSRPPFDTEAVADETPTSRTPLLSAS